MPRYVILGAGAVGGALGGRLGLAGRDVVPAARGDHLAALREHGLRLRTPEEDVTQSVLAIAGPDEIELSGDDILILATKTQLISSSADRPGSPCNGAPGTSKRTISTAKS